MSRGDRGDGESEERPLSSIEDAPTLASDEPVASTLIAPTVSGWPLAADEDDDTSFPEVDQERYQIEGEHARGGIGRIMKARDRRLGRPVAIKELLDAGSGNEVRFLREARVTARLEHPAIVPVHDLGRWEDGGPFYSMKMVSGQSLKERIDACAGMEDRLALLPNLIAVVDAIAYAHSQGVIHRDLKPQNVIVGPFGETVVIDWGLAKDTRHEGDDEDEATPYRVSGDSLTIVGTVMGTPAYMPPEQARGDEVDERADIYALGAILYHLLRGSAPYKGTESADVVAAVLDGPPPALDDEDGPGELVAIANKAMARDAGTRYGSAIKLAADLKRFQTGKLVTAHSYSRWSLLKRWLLRYRAPVAVAAVAVVLLAAMAVASVRHIMMEKDIAQAQRRVAEGRTLQLLEEQGRRELLAQKPLRAAVYLSRAWAEKRSPTVGWLLADAMRPLDALMVSVNASDDGITDQVLVSGGTVVVTADDKGGLRLADARTGEQRWAIKAHDKQIRQVAASSDGKRIVTGSFDGKARLWRGTGELIATVTESKWGVMGVAVSPDGRRAVVSSRSTVIMVATADGKELWRRDAKDYTTNTAFSPDGAQVAVAGASGTVQVNDAETGALVYTLTGHHSGVWVVRFSRDGASLISTSADNSARLWDRRTGKLRHQLAGHTALVHDAAFSPDSRFVATASNDRTARVWNVATGALVHKLEGHDDIVASIRYDPSGSLLLTASNDGTARLWDATSGRAIATLTGHRRCTSAEITADGRRIITTGDDGSMRIWKSTGWKRIATLAKHTARLSTGEFSADGRVLTAGFDGFVHIWSSTGKHLAALDAGPEKAPGKNLRMSADASPEKNREAMRNMMRAAAYMVVSARFSPDGKRVVAVSSNGTIKLFDSSSGKKLSSVRAPHAGLGATAFSPDSRVLAVAAGKIVRLFEISKGKALVTLKGHTANVREVIFSRDGRLLVTASDDNTARIWSVTGELRHTLGGHGRRVTSLDISADGAMVVTSSDDKLARVWRTSTGQLLHTLAGRMARFSPAGDRLATGSRDGSGRIWDSATGVLVAALDGHRNTIRGLAWSPDGTRVITASADATARIWEAANGRLLAKLEGHADEVVAASFDPSGRIALTVGRDGRGVLWSVEAEQRPADEINRLVAERSPWRLVEGRLVPANKPAPQP
jgi:WD40 repeat protein/tRNA A-37 threonylcarbamoyl transferase component Bud32